MREISGDRKLNLLEKIYYLFFNAFKGLLGQLSVLPSTFWFTTNDELGNDSPARILSDSFFKKRIREIFADKNIIKVLDVGCGSGYVRRILAEAGLGGTYVGVDVQEHADFHKGSVPEFTSSLILCSAEDIDNYVKKADFDLILSYTSLEHILFDEIVISKLDPLANEFGKSIHIVPSTWALPLYLFHGYRQYSRKRIKKIFSSYDYRVWRLGGAFSFFLHFFALTLPERMMGRMVVRSSQSYPKLLKFCLKMDRFLPILSSMYCIEINHAK